MAEFKFSNIRIHRNNVGLKFAKLTGLDPKYKFSREFADVDSFLWTQPPRAYGYDATITLSDGVYWMLKDGWDEATYLLVEGERVEEISEDDALKYFSADKTTAEPERVESQEKAERFVVFEHPLKIGDLASGGRVVSCEYTDDAQNDGENPGYIIGLVADEQAEKESAIRAAEKKAEHARLAYSGYADYDEDENERRFKAWQRAQKELERLKGEIPEYS